MDKAGFKIAIVILIFIFVISAATSIKYMTEISRGLNVTYSETKEKDIPKYHFMIISNELNFSSGQAFINGAELACKDYNAVIEINEFKRENIEEQIRNISIAVASKVDGIIVQATDQDMFYEPINKAIEAGIPVITIFEDSPKSQRLSHIGINSYELGIIAADLAAKAVDNEGQMAVIFDGLEGKQFDTSKNLIEAGIREGLKNNQDMSIKKIDISASGILGILGASDITKEIIRDYPRINAIFCTSAINTLGVAQVIIDLNRVGKIKIIGYGDDQEILRYIEKGVIDYSLVSDNESIGYQSIESIIKYINEGRISDFEDAEIYVIDKNNISSFINKNIEAGEEF